uniref:Uncharacterized protein n=1 Tax=Cacopsylla melanoneura TaxID=428564 RepID=A0A8D8Z978_9HEMI
MNIMYSVCTYTAYIFILLPLLSIKKHDSKITPGIEILIQASLMRDISQRHFPRQGYILYGIALFLLIYFLLFKGFHIDLKHIKSIVSFSTPAVTFVSFVAIFLSKASHLESIGKYYCK